MDKIDYDKIVCEICGLIDDTINDNAWLVVRLEDTGIFFCCVAYYMEWLEERPKEPANG